jgi:hypothetical protein
MVQKMLIIEKCRNCPHLHFEMNFPDRDELLSLDAAQDFTIKPCCTNESPHRFITEEDEPIPNWCKLPDTQPRRGSR